MDRSFDQKTVAVSFGSACDGHLPEFGAEKRPLKLRCPEAATRHRVHRHSAVLRFARFGATKQSFDRLGLVSSDFVWAPSTLPSMSGPLFTASSVRRRTGTRSAMNCLSLSSGLLAFDLRHECGRTPGCSRQPSAAAEPARWAAHTSPGYSRATCHRFLFIPSPPWSPGLSSA